ncbi:CENP-B N-terminal DNA-binding domain [Popillia japonica]|uniref:CENP-B N-terminal DNA-binding domain n=1 Tax=Popillia japonica TaxID=7064 RepID=A0AAW1LQK4_POPJA
MADKKRKHETLSLVKKMEILRKLDSGANQMKLAGEYGVGRATICNIKKNREKIENFASTADAGTSSRQTRKFGDSEQDDLKMTLLSPTNTSVKAEDALQSIDVSIRWAEENNAIDDILLNLRICES